MRELCNIEVFKEIAWKFSINLMWNQTVNKWNLRVSSRWRDRTCVNQDSRRDFCFFGKLSVGYSRRDFEEERVGNYLNGELDQSSSRGHPFHHFSIRHLPLRWRFSGLSFSLPVTNFAFQPCKTSYLQESFDPIFFMVLLTNWQINDPESLHVAGAGMVDVRTRRF